MIEGMRQSGEGLVEPYCIGRGGEMSTLCHCGGEVLRVIGHGGSERVWLWWLKHSGKARGYVPALAVCCVCGVWGGGSCCECHVVHRTPRCASIAPKLEPKPWVANGVGPGSCPPSPPPL